MTRKSRINYLKAISHNVERKKMYKAKKQWIVAGMSFLVATGLVAIGSHLTTHADVTQTSIQSQKHPTPNSSVSSGSSSATKSNVQSALNKLDAVQSNANHMYRGLMLNAATKSNNLSNEQPDAKTQPLAAGSNGNNVNNLAKPETNSSASQSTSNTTPTGTSTNNTSSSSNNNSSAESETKPTNTQSSVTSSGSNKDKTSLAPINKKGSFNSAYQNYEAQMGGINSNVASINAINAKKNSYKKNIKESLIKDNTDYFSGGTKDTGNDEGLNYTTYNNGGVEFTGGSLNINSDISLFTTDNWDLFNAKAINFDDGINTNGITNMHDMLFNALHAISINLGNNFNTSKVTNMDEMFSNDVNLQSVSLGNSFDTSKVTSMDGIFDGDSNLGLLIIQSPNTKISDKQGSDSLPNMYRESGGKDSNNIPYTLSTPNDFSQGTVGTFTTHKNPMPLCSDIYSSIDGTTGNPQYDPSKWALVNAQGKEVKDAQINGNGHVMVAPVDDGLTYKFNTNTGYLEFTGGTAPSDLSTFTLDYDGPDGYGNDSVITEAKTIKFDNNINFSHVNNTHGMLIGNSLMSNDTPYTNPLHKIIIDSSNIKFNNSDLPRQSNPISHLSQTYKNTIGMFIAGVENMGGNLTSSINSMSSIFNGSPKIVKEDAIRALLNPVNFYKVSDNGKYTSSTPNNFNQGNVGTFTTTPNPKSDTIIYQNDNKNVGTQSNMISTFNSDDGNYSDVKATKIPSGYHLANGAITSFPLDGNTHYVKVAPNDKTDTINYQVDGSNVATQTYKGNGSFNVANDHASLSSNYEIVSGANTTFSYNGSSYSVPVYDFGSASNQANTDINAISSIDLSKASSVNSLANSDASSASADTNMSSVNNQKTQENGWYSQVQFDIGKANSAKGTAQTYANDVKNDASNRNEAQLKADLAKVSTFAGSARTDANSANGIINEMNDNVTPNEYPFSSASITAAGIKPVSVSSYNATSFSTTVSNNAKNNSNSDEATNYSEVQSQSTQTSSASNAISQMISSVSSYNKSESSYLAALSSASNDRNAASASADLSNAQATSKALSGLNAQTNISNDAKSLEDDITPINATSAKDSSATANSDSKSASSYASDVNTNSDSATKDSKTVDSDLSKTSSTAADYKELSNLNSSDTKYSSEIHSDLTKANNDKTSASQYASAVISDYYHKYNNSSNAGYLASSYASAASYSASYYKSSASDENTAASSALGKMKSIASQLSSGLALNSDSTKASQDSSAISSSDITPTSNDNTSAGQISNSASTENSSSSMTSAESQAISASVSGQNSKDSSLSTAISEDSSTVSSASSAASSASNFISNYAKSMATGSTSVTSGMISSASSATSSASAAKSAADSAKNDANTKLGQMTSTNFSSLYIESSEASLDDSLANSYASNDAEKISSIASGYNNSASNDLNGNDISYQNTTDNTHYGELTSSEASVNSFSNDVTADIASANSYTSAGNSASANNEESKASTDAASASQYLASVKDDYALITDMTKPVQKGTVISGDISDISHDSASTNSFMSNSNNSAHSVTSSEINYDSSVISSASNAASQDSTDQNMTDANTQKSLADSAYNNASEDALIESGIASDNNPHVYGVATVHLVYNVLHNVLQAGTKNIVSQNTKDIYIPINTRVGSPSMTINPWNYSKSYYDQSNSDWTINFKPSDFKDFSGHLASDQFTNLSDNPTHTFTYNATQAGDVVVKYYSDIDNGNQHVNDPIKNDDLGNFDGLVGQQVTLTTSDVGTGDGIYGKLNIPAGYHLAHQLNTITLQAPDKNNPNKAGLILMAPVIKNTQDSNVNKPAKSATTNNSSSNQAQSNEASNVVIPNTPTSNIAPATSENNNYVDNNNTRATNTPLQAITAQASHKLDEMNKPARIVKLVHHHSNKKNELFYAHIHHAQVPVDKLPRVWSVHQLNKVGRGHTVRFGRVIVTSLSGRHSYEFRILKHVYLHKKIYFTHGKFHSLKPNHKALRINRIFLVHQGRHIYIRLELRFNHHTYFITGKKPYVKGPYKLL